MIFSDRALSLNRESLNTVIDWQRAAGSLEICGFFAVDQFGEQHLLRLTNHANQIGAFEISRSEEQTVRAAAALRGWEIVAFLHTHPHHPPEMSPRDFRSFEREALPWIIIGTPVSDPTQRTYIHTPVLSGDDLRSPACIGG